MAKKQRGTNKSRHEQHQKEVIDNYARILQMVAILAVVFLIVFGALVPSADIPIYVPAGLLGVAVGLSPDQIGKILTDIFKTMFTGRGGK